MRTVASGSVQAPTKSSQHNVAEGFDIDSAGPWTPLPLMLLLLPPPRPPPPTPLAAAMTDAASIHFMQLSLGCMRRIVSSMRERRRKKDGKGKGCMCGKGRHFSYIRNWHETMMLMEKIWNRNFARETVRFILINSVARMRSFIIAIRVV